jgi:nuclear transport factor 2 (NTF2) superfamily protein
MERCCIIKDKNEIEYGVRQMLERYWYVRNKINKTNAYTDDETKERIKFIQEREFLQKYLKMLGIQDFEIKSEWLVFNIE